jgi:NADH:ubiquinone reductase (H+-translocating)
MSQLKFEEDSLRSTKRIVILGSGFAGIEVLKKLQKKFHSNKNIEIILVSKDKFLLFTPMLPEVASGMIETAGLISLLLLYTNKQAQICSRTRTN